MPTASQREDEEDALCACAVEHLCGMPLAVPVSLSCFVCAVGCRRAWKRLRWVLWPQDRDGTAEDGGHVAGWSLRRSRAEAARRTWPKRWRGSAWSSTAPTRWTWPPCPSSSRAWRPPAPGPASTSSTASTWRRAQGARRWCLSGTRGWLPCRGCHACQSVGQLDVTILLCCDLGLPVALCLLRVSNACDGRLCVMRRCCRSLRSRCSRYSRRAAWRSVQ
jgi:hypothetical protein